MVISPLTSLTSDLYSFANVIAHDEKEMCTAKCKANPTVAVEDLNKADNDAQNHSCLLHSLSIPASRFFVEHALLRRERTT